MLVDSWIYIQNIKVLIWSVLDFLFFKYSHVHYEIPWGWDPSLNKKSINVPYIPHTHNRKVILEFLVCLWFDLGRLSHEVRCRIIHLWHHISVEKVSYFGTFQISHFWISRLGPFNSTCLCRKNEVCIWDCTREGQGDIGSRKDTKGHELPSVLFS